MPERINFHKRQVERTRRRRGGHISNQPEPKHITHDHLHHPVSPHHGEPVVRDIAKKIAKPLTPEKTVFEPRVAENLLIAKAYVVTNIVATVQAGIDSGFTFTAFHNASRKTEQDPAESPMHQLTPAVKAVGHHVAIVGTLAKNNEEGFQAHIQIQSASLMAVQVKPDGLHPIETLLSVDFPSESFLGNLHQEADLRLLHLTGSVLQMMHDQLVINRPQN